MASHRDMVRRKDINYQRQEINKTIERSVEVARTTVRGMLGSYKDGVSQSIGLRRTIVNEVELAQRQNVQKKLNRIDTDSFLPQIEKWELRGRDLYKHRIRKIIEKNYSKAHMINCFKQRMEEYDSAFNDIKDRESFTEMEEIIITFERDEDRRNEILGKMYLIGNEKEELNTMNKNLERYNQEIRDLLVELAADGSKSDQAQANRDKILTDKVRAGQRELAQIDDEFLEFKAISQNAFLHFSGTAIGRSIEITDKVAQSDLVSLGMFDPLKVIGWFGSLIDKLNILNLKEVHNKSMNNTTMNNTTMPDLTKTNCDNSTTVDVSRSNKNADYSGSDWIQPGNKILIGLGDNDNSDLDLTDQINNQTKKAETVNDLGDLVLLGKKIFPKKNRKFHRQAQNAQNPGTNQNFQQKHSRQRAKKDNC